MMTAMTTTSADSAGACVAACYATWSESYYDDYYGPRAAYPPVHVDLILGLLRRAGSRTVLDAGCGPASMLRHLVRAGFEVGGFDLTPGMVDEARRVLAEEGVDPGRVWQGNVQDPASYRPLPGGQAHDAAICVGVLPHIEVAAQAAVLANLRNSVKPGGLVVVEARNQLFSL